MNNLFICLLFLIGLMAQKHFAPVNPNATK